MALSKALLAEFDHEMGNTRRTLERVPDEKLGWKPHEKSFSMGDLASHLANIPSWVAHIIESDSLDLAPPGEAPMRTERANSQGQLLEVIDKNVAAARASMAEASDDHLFKPWSLLSGGKTIFTLPRIAALRSFVMNHNIHHRAQMGVYLRLNDLPVPSIYGPSADEEGM